MAPLHFLISCAVGFKVGIRRDLSQVSFTDKLSNGKDIKINLNIVPSMVSDRIDSLRSWGQAHGGSILDLHAVAVFSERDVLQSIPLLSAPEVDREYLFCRYKLSMTEFAVVIGTGDRSDPVRICAILQLKRLGIVSDIFEGNDWFQYKKSDFIATNSDLECASLKLPGKDRVTVCPSSLIIQACESTLCTDITYPLSRELPDPQTRAELAYDLSTQFTNRGSSSGSSAGISAIELSSGKMGCVLMGMTEPIAIMQKSAVVAPLKLCSTTYQYLRQYPELSRLILGFDELYYCFPCDITVRGALTHSRYRPVHNKHSMRAGVIVVCNDYPLFLKFSDRCL
jgi:hypothetical protein